MTYSLIIPVYKNEASLPELLDTLTALAAGLRLEVIFVVDGSPDRSYAILRDALPECPFSSQLLSHSRNFGSFAAIRTGMEHAKGECMAVMAADLQEPPELIRRMFETLRTGESDVVIGVRRKRHDPLFSRWASMLFWKVYRRWIQPEIPPGGVDIFGCTSSVGQQLLQLDEANSSLIGLLFWMGYRRSYVEYDRQPRRHGSSAWSFTKRLTYLSNSLFSFTHLPLRLLLFAGGMGMTCAVLMAAVVLEAKLHRQIPVPGYAATVCVVIFFGALNCFGIGLLGSYLWRTFENTKRRPQAIVMRKEEFLK